MKPAAKDNNRLAILVILATGFFLALGDAIIKGISADFTLWQIFTLRSLLVLPVLMLALRWRSGRFLLWPRRPGWTLVRSTLLCVMWIAYYCALLDLELSIASALYYSSPIFITLLAALWLGDSVGRLGGLAVVLGLGGVLLILQPKPGELSFYALLPLLSALAYALAMLLTRSHCAREEPLLLSIWLNAVMLLVGLVFSLALAWWSPAGPRSASVVFLFGDWAPLGLRQWAFLLLLALSIIVGSVGAAVAYQFGRPAVVATFDYGYVAFAVLWGVLLFQELPNRLAALGILLVFAAGLLANRQAGRQPPTLRESR